MVKRVEPGHNAKEYQLGAHPDYKLHNILKLDVTPFSGKGGIDKNKNVIPGPKDVCLSKARAAGHTFAAVLRLPYKNGHGAWYCRRYMSARNYAEFVVACKRLRRHCDAHPDECILSDWPLCITEVLCGIVKPNLDIEKVGPLPPDLPPAGDEAGRRAWIEHFELNVAKMLTPLIVTALRRVGVSVAPANVCWLGGSRVKRADKDDPGGRWAVGDEVLKFSTHVIVHSPFRFEQQHQARVVAAYLREELASAGEHELAAEGVIDEAIYTRDREMRMIGMGKPVDQDKATSLFSTLVPSPPLRRILLNECDADRPETDYIISAVTPGEAVALIDMPKEYADPPPPKGKRKRAAGLVNAKEAARGRRDAIIEVVGADESDESEVEVGATRFRRPVLWDAPLYDPAFLKRLVLAVDAEGPRTLFIKLLQVLWNVTAPHGRVHSVGRALAILLGSRWRRTDAGKPSSYYHDEDKVTEIFDGLAPCAAHKRPVMLGTLMHHITDRYKLWMTIPERHPDEAAWSANAIHFSCSDLRTGVRRATLSDPHLPHLPARGEDEDAQCPLNDAMRGWLLGAYTTAVMRATPGTGKTWLAALISEYARFAPRNLSLPAGAAIPSEILQPAKRILLVTPRRTLAAETYARLQRLGFINYLDGCAQPGAAIDVMRPSGEDWLAAQDRVIICVKSLHRLRRWDEAAKQWVVPEFDLVIFDELEVTLAFRASHLMVSDQRNRRLCDEITQKAARVLVLDADYGARSHDWVRAVLPDAPPRVLINDWRADKRVFHFTNQLDVLQRVMAAVSKGERVVVVCGGKNAVQKIGAAAEQLGVSVTVMTGLAGEKTRLDIGAFKLKASRTCLLGLNGVAQVGVSVEHPVDHVFVLWSAKSAPPFATWQLSWRARNVRPNGVNGETVVYVAQCDSYMELPFSGAHVRIDDQERWDGAVSGGGSNGIELRIRAHNNRELANRDQDYVRTLAAIYIENGYAVRGLDHAEDTGWVAVSKEAVAAVKKEDASPIDQAVASVLKRHDTTAGYLAQAPYLTWKEARALKTRTGSGQRTADAEEHSYQAAKAAHDFGLLCVCGKKGRRVLEMFGADDSRRSGLRRCVNYLRGRYDKPPELAVEDTTPEAFKLHRLMQLFDTMSRNKADPNLPHHLFDIGRPYDARALARAHERAEAHAKAHYDGDWAKMRAQCGLPFDRADTNKAKRRRADPSQPRDAAVVRLYKAVFNTFGLSFIAVDKKGTGTFVIATQKALLTLELVSYKLAQHFEKWKLDFTKDIWEARLQLHLVDGIELPSVFTKLRDPPKRRPQQTESMTIFSGAEVAESEAESGSESEVETEVYDAMDHNARESPARTDTPLSAKSTVTKSQVPNNMVSAPKLKLRTTRRDWAAIAARKRMRPGKLSWDASDSEDDVTIADSDDERVDDKNTL